jgi:uncharacterized membrane protein YqjE
MMALTLYFITLKITVLYAHVASGVRPAMPLAQSVKQESAFLTMALKPSIMTARRTVRSAFPGSGVTKAMRTAPLV